MITSPYNFVPLSGTVYTPKDANLISQDIPFVDGEDGVINLIIQNCSPLFVRNGHRRDINDEFSSHVLLADGTRKYFIPASTVKGSLRSVMEILSAGRMSVYNQDSFGKQRPFGKQQNPDRFKELVKNVKCGWLTKDNDDIFISPCSEGVQTIHHDALKDISCGAFNKGSNKETAEVKQRSIQKGAELFPEYFVDETIDKYAPQGYYRIVCTGFMHNKKHEYLFSSQLDENIRVSDSDFKAFESIHKANPVYGDKEKTGYLRSLLYSGKAIPVFYVIENNTIIMGLTRMLRYPLKHTVKDAVNNSQRPSSGMDMADAIFGYTSKETSLKGRVHIGHAWDDSFINDGELISVKGVLGSPKASFYPFYLKQHTSPFKTYDTDGVEIAGRKRYRIFPGSKTRELPRNQSNSKVETSFRAIPAGHSFKCSIAIHNMRPFEIGALLSAITFNLTDGTYHNIGMAKSFGYGKITMTIDSLSGLCLSVEDYIKKFEYELAKHGHNLQHLGNKLVAIASEHDINSVKMMEMEHKVNNKKIDEYNEAKNNKAFETLIEDDTKLISTILNETDILQLSNQERAQKQEEEEQREKRKDAKIKLQNFFERINNQIGIKAWKEAKQLIIHAKKLADDFKFAIDELILAENQVDEELRLLAGTPLSEMIKGRKLAASAGQTKKWINNGNVMNDEQLDVIANHISQLPAKEWNEKLLKKHRKDFVKAMGEEWTDKLYEKLKG